MVWLSVYSGVATLVAAGSFVSARGFRARPFPAPDRTVFLAGLAGLMWPILVVGLVQIGAVMALKALYVTNTKRNRAKAAGEATTEPSVN